MCVCVCVGGGGGGGGREGGGVGGGVGAVAVAPLLPNERFGSHHQPRYHSRPGHCADNCKMVN